MKELFAVNVSALGFLDGETVNEGESPNSDRHGSQPFRCSTVEDSPHVDRLTRDYLTRKGLDTNKLVNISASTSGDFYDQDLSLTLSPAMAMALAERLCATLDAMLREGKIELWTTSENFARGLAASVFDGATLGAADLKSYLDLQQQMCLPKTDGESIESILPPSLTK